MKGEEWVRELTMRQLAKMLVDGGEMDQRTVRLKTFVAFARAQWASDELDAIFEGKVLEEARQNQITGSGP